MKDKFWNQIHGSTLCELQEEEGGTPEPHRFIEIVNLSCAAANKALEERKAMFTREFNKISKQALLGPILTSNKKRQLALSPSTELC